MKSVPSLLAAHLQGAVTTIARCWKITRTDGAVFRFTEHDADLVVAGETYLATSGFQASSITADSSLAVDNLEVLGILDHEQIEEAELRAGWFDYAEVRIFAVNWADPSQGRLRLRRGWLGEVTVTDQGTYRAELRGLTQALAQQIGGLYQPTCRADLGDAQCKVVIQPPTVQRATAYALGDLVRAYTETAETETVGSYRDWGDVYYEATTAGTTGADAPSWAATVGATTADGTVVWTARNAFLRGGRVVAVTDRHTFALALTEPRAGDKWFDFGGLIWAEASNIGTTEVKAWTKAAGDETPARAGTATLYLPTPRPVGVGDRCLIYPGCAKRALEDCKGKFGNILNFRGEPYLPGLDLLTSYPDSR
jgi:hypothetical protein